MTRTLYRLFLLLGLSALPATAQDSAQPREEGIEPPPAYVEPPAAHTGVHVRPAPHAGVSVEVKPLPPGGVPPTVTAEPRAPQFTVESDEAETPEVGPEQDSRVAELVAAYNSVRPMPRVSQGQRPIDLAGAYILQRDFVQVTQGGQPIAGFKAGLSSRKAQLQFATDGPVSGVLPRTGRRDVGAAIEMSEFSTLMVECEFAFILAKPIDKPVKDVATLRGLVGGIAPAIELPDLGFVPGDTLSVQDIVAANVGARAYIIGEPIEVDDRDLNDTKISLTHNGIPVNEGEGADAMRDQWRALLWLVNQSVAQGYTLQPGQVLITGALGSMVKAEPGVYVAAFGEIGTIHFTVRP